ncbi:winged helix-turn-helix transcriptional regulator [Actinocorallia aurea]
MTAEARPSAIGQALLAIGDQWTLLILQRAFHQRIRRFADWRDALGVSESVLAARLRELQAGGLLAPSPYRTDGRTRTEYLLTEKSLDLWPLLIALWSWERAWVPRRTALPALLHHGCGAPTDADLACAACGRAPVTARDITAERGTATFARLAVPRLHRRSSRAPTDALSYFPETFEILGDRWATVLLAAALLGVRRFADFERELGVSPSVLAHRLRRFTDLGVLRAEGAGAARRYLLTDKGAAFSGVFALLADWAQRWHTGPPGSDVRLLHQACGQPLRPALRCRGCGTALERTQVAFAPADAPAPAG